MRYCYLKTLIMLVIVVSSSYSQELVPPIQNYKPAEYAAASQNWDIAVDERGVVYTANHQGLLVFDGLSWELFPLDSRSIIRSVYPHKGRVYTGSYQEFGYWETTPEGCMIYNSLTPLMEKFNLQSDEFWEITSFNDEIYFRSFGGVFKYSGEKIIRIEDIVSTSFGKYQDKLIVAHRNNGLLYLDESEEAHTLEGDLNLLKGLNVVDMEALGDSLIVGSRDALFYYHDKKLRKFWNKDLNELLSKFELNHIEKVSGNQLVFGSIKSGMIHYDLASDTFQVYNRASGLQNNTILGLTYRKGKLWLALDKGVDMIDLKAPIRFYTDNTGELGAVYDMQIYNGKYYLASNTGIYRFSNNKLELIENAEDHTWNLELIDNTLYANHNKGIFKIENDRFIPIDERTGSFSIQKMGDKFLICHYTGLSLYDPDTGEIREFEGVNFPIKKVVFENDHTIWAAHPYEGIYRIEFEDLDKVQVEKTPFLGDRPNYNPEIYNVNNQILAFVNQKWYKYNPFNEKFEDFKELASYANSRLIHQGNNYVFVNPSDGALAITDLKENNIDLSAHLLDQRLVKTNENFIEINDSISYVTLNDGFARINLKELNSPNDERWISEPFIKEFSDETQNYALDNSPVIPYNNSRNISLKAGLPVSQANVLRYELKGEEDLSGIIKTGQLNFRNLEHGDYELHLSALGSGLDKINNTTFSFTIAPPWYFSIWMKLVYGFLFLSLFFLMYWLNRQKLRKHQLQLEEKFEKEHSERLNRLEKEKLMNEIDLKRKELANTTMMAAKKNEVLMEIQGELNKDKGKFSNQFRLKHIMNKINNAVKNKDEWKVFETNFNEVHEDFFKEILQQYPKLTNKDLKLCSYLKMNLSSKEIAPLMGISVRGVEVHRYRLRKKMKLDSNVNLTKFLIKNF